jgi:hypothetical protein
MLVSIILTGMLLSIAATFSGLIDLHYVNTQAQIESYNWFVYSFRHIHTAYRNSSFTIPHQTQIRVITSATLTEILLIVCMDNSGILLLLHICKLDPCLQI